MKSIFLSVAFALFGFISVSQTNNPNYELLWQVSKPGQPVSYLFGSLHSNDRRLFNLPDSVYIALDQSDAIALETDIFSIFETFEWQYGVDNIEFDRDGKPYTKSNKATSTSYGNEDGMPQFLDAYFQQYCHNAGKDFQCLESVEFQLGLLADSGMVPQEGSFNANFMQSSKEEMVELYLTGNIYKLNDFVESGLSLYPELYEEIIVNRNISMAIILDSIMKSQSIFCAVGAGHLAGSAGMLNLLQSKGYKVRKVMATYAEEKTEAEQKVKSQRQYEIYDERSNLNIVFPGKPVEIDSEYETYIQKWLYCDLGQGNKYEVEIHERQGINSWEEIASEYLPSPKGGDYEKIELPNGGEAIQGLAQEYYFDSMSWIRVLSTEEFIIVLKATGGNKFMNSPRAFLFFDGVGLK